MKIVIESITEWEKDDAEIDGDLCHGLTKSESLLALADEVKAKEESEWTKGLPFTWEQDVELDVSAAVDIAQDIRGLMDDALTQYSDQYCAGDYLKPVWFEGRVVA